MIGDKVICVRNDPGSRLLTIGKIYTVLKHNNSQKVQKILIKDNLFQLNYYLYDRFINVTEQREQKLKRILNG